MPIERTGFQIDLTVDAAGAVKGADQAGKSLQGVAAATKELSTNLEEGKGKLDDAGKAAEKGGEGFKVFGHGAHETHAAMRALNEAIPGFEQMARFLTNGLTAMMGIGAIAIGFLKGKIDEMNQALDSLNASPGARGEWAEKLRDRAEESAESFEVWIDHIERLRKAEQSLAELTDRNLAVAREKISTENEISRAQTELAEARLELAVKLGQVTPEQAVKIKLEIDEAAFKQQLEVKAAEIQAEINSRSLEQSSNNLLMPQKWEAANQAKGAADVADAAKIKNDAKIAQDQKNLDESVARQNKAQEIIESLEGKGMWGGKYDKSDPQYYTLQQARDTVESESRRQGNLKQSKSQEEGSQKALHVNAETAKTSYDEAKAAYDEATRLQRETNIKLANLAQDLAAEKAKAAALESLHDQTAATKAGFMPPPALSPAAPHASAATVLDALQTQIAQAEKSVDFAHGKVAGGNHAWDNALADGIRRLHELMGRVVAISGKASATADDSAAGVNQLAEMVHDLDGKIKNLEASQKRSDMRANNNRNQ